MNEKNYEIVNLIRRFLLNDLSEDEQRMLDAWREESEEREFFFQRILAGEEFKDRQEICFLALGGSYMFAFVGGRNLGAC